MANERIVIEVSEKGSRVVSRKISDIGKSAQTSQGSLKLLQRSLGFLSAGAVIGGLVKLADSFTNIQNRIKTVTTGTAQLNAVTQQLFEIANRTRSSYEGTAEVYARTALAVKELGISQQQTLQFSESLNQAVILSGASAQEASNAMIQLSQGLASGTLRGDELRSVLEQLPVVADVISKELGITRGELREMGKEGKITADIILEAFKNAKDELAEGFANTVPTIGQSFQVLRNQIVRTIGELDKASGVSTALAKTILFLAKNIDTVARSVIALAIALGTTLAAKAIPAAIGAFKALTAAIAANPIGAIAVAITAGTAALIAFSDELTVTTGSLTTVADFGKAVFEQLVVYGQTAVAYFQATFGPAIASVGQYFTDILGDAEFTFKNIVLLAAKGADSIINAYSSLAKAIVAAFTNLPRALGDIFIRAINGLISIAEGGANKIIEALNKPFELLDLEPVAKVQIERFTNAFEGGLSNLGGLIEQGLVEGQQGTLFEDFVNGAFDRADQIAIERVANQKKIIAEEQAAFDQLAIAGPRTAVASDDEKAKKKIKDVKQELTGLAAVVEGGVNNAFDSATDAIINFAQTGELNVRDMVTSMLADLAKLAFQQGISQIASGISGGAASAGGGNIGSVLGGLVASGFATGGSSMVSGQGGTDSQTVAFRATPGERVDVLTPQQQMERAKETEAQAAPQDPLNLKVVNVTSPEEVLNIMSSDAGEKVIYNWLDMNVNEIAARVQR